LPTAASCKAASEVTSLVIEAIQNTVSVVIGSEPATERRPKAAL